jgi:hypothetical protein
MIITLKDCRKHFYCVRGVKTFLETHGVDWREFREHGITDAACLAFNDGMVDTLVEKVRKDREHEQGRR